MAGMPAKRLSNPQVAATFTGSSELLYNCKLGVSKNRGKTPKMDGL